MQVSRSTSTNVFQQENQRFLPNFRTFSVFICARMQTRRTIITAGWKQPDATNVQVIRVCKRNLWSRAGVHSQVIDQLILESGQSAVFNLIIGLAHADVYAYWRWINTVKYIFQVSFVWCYNYTTYLIITLTTTVINSHQVVLIYMLSYSCGKDKNGPQDM